MVSGRSARAERVGLRIDRAVAAVAVSALILSLILGLRIVAERLTGGTLPTLAGIRLLSPEDRLITFEDFELGVPGWTGGAQDRSTPEFGGMMGRFGGTGGEEAVSRTYEIDPGAGFATVSFDLHAIDDWALEDVIVFANGVEILRQNFSTRPDMIDRQRSLVADLDWMRADLRPSPRSGRERGFGGGTDALRDQTIHVRLVLLGPPEELRLGFGSTLPSAGSDSASWAIDNLQIVTTARPPD